MILQVPGINFQTLREFFQYKYWPLESQPWKGLSAFDIYWLVGGWTTPFEKSYARQIRLFPQGSGVNIRNVRKAPLGPSFIWTLDEIGYRYLQKVTQMLESQIWGHIQNVLVDVYTFNGSNPSPYFKRQVDQVGSLPTKWGSIENHFGGFNPFEKKPSSCWNWKNLQVRWKIKETLKPPLATSKSSWNAQYSLQIQLYLPWWNHSKCVCFLCFTCSLMYN